MTHHPIIPLTKVRISEHNKKNKSKKIRDNIAVVQNAVCHARREKAR
jgi:hypothetical protein